MIASTAVYVYYRVYRSKGDPANIEVLDPIVLLSLAWYGLICAVSVGKLFIAGYSSLPMFIIFAIVSELMIAGRNSTAPEEQARIKGGKIALALLFLLLAANITGKTFYRTFMGPSVLKSTQRSDYGRMAGIYSSHQRISQLEELLRYLRPRVKEGDRLLSFKSFQLLNYLTGTLPAMDTCQLTDTWPVKSRELLLKRMIAEHHTPEYAVRLLVWPRNLENIKTATPILYSEDPKADPIYVFVKKNYTLEKNDRPVRSMEAQPGLEIAHSRFLCLFR